MKLRLRRIEVDAGRPVIFITPDTAKKMDVHVGERIEVYSRGKRVISVVDIMKGLISQNEIAVSGNSKIRANPQDSCACQAEN